MDVTIDTVQNDAQFAIYHNESLFKVYDLDKYGEVLENMRYFAVWANVEFYIYEYKLRQPLDFPSWFTGIPRNWLSYKEFGEWV